MKPLKFRVNYTLTKAGKVYERYCLTSEPTESKAIAKVADMLTKKQPGYIVRFNSVQPL